MLSYKNYKILNESLYGNFNLGIKSQDSLTSPIGAYDYSETSCKSKKVVDEDKDEEEMEEDEEEKKVKHKKHKEDKEDKEEDNGLTKAQKKLPKGLQDAILKNKKKNKKKVNEEVYQELLDNAQAMQVTLEAIATVDEKGSELLKAWNAFSEKLVNIESSEEEEISEMSEDEKAWWKSVNSQLAGEIGFAPVGKITQAIR